MIIYRLAIYKRVKNRKYTKMKKRVIRIIAAAFLATTILTTVQIINISKIEKTTVDVIDEARVPITGNQPIKGNGITVHQLNF